MSWPRQVLQAQLTQGLAALKLSHSDQQLQQWLDFLALLHKWNRVYNLSAVRDPMAMVSRHLLDSLCVLPHIQGERCLDVGSGAGLPGMPLAIARPDMQFCLLDSNSKKTRFMQQAAIELKLGNVEVTQTRVQAYRPQQKFDTVIARAFTALPELQKLTRHLLVDQGQLLAMTAREEDAQSPLPGQGFRFVRSVELSVPGCVAERRLKLFEAV